ncbi:hypothetical protein DO73_5521 [Burkholderia pseudomallei]|nr:hypothetical protein DO73_5521 [Burkholderia pseudomallei]
MPSAILPVSIDSVPLLIASRIASTWVVSISALPEAARLRSVDDRPDRLTFASPPVGAPAAPAGV